MTPRGTMNSFTRIVKLPIQHVIQRLGYETFLKTEFRCSVWSANWLHLNACYVYEEALKPAHIKSIHTHTHTHTHTHRTNFKKLSGWQCRQFLDKYRRTTVSAVSVSADTGVHKSQNARQARTGRNMVKSSSSSAHST